MGTHTSQSPREGFPIMPGGKETMKCWTESIWPECPVRDKAGSVGLANPQKLGEHRRFTTSAGEKTPKRGELSTQVMPAGGLASAVGQGLLGRCAG